MRTVYLDMCALKRPFDDQSQGRIAIETQAVIRILDAARAGTISLMDSPALQFENRMNPKPVRRTRVAAIMAGFDVKSRKGAGVYRKAQRFAERGIDSLDALHLALADDGGAEWFVTCDEDLLKKASGLELRVRVADPASLVKEANL